MVDEELAAAVLLAPQAGHGRVHDDLDGVVEPQLVRQTRALQLDAARRTRRHVLQPLQQARLAN